MAIVRAQVVIPHLSALPEDVTVNTFHFLATGAVDAADLDSIEGLISDFYFGTPTGEGGPIRAFWSNNVQEDLVRLKLYDLTAPEPRQPLRDVEIGVEGAVAGDALPGEVALCLSFQAVGESGSPQARRRGRIYFGPLGQAAMATSGDTERPNPGLISRLVAAGQDLVDAAAASVTPWVVYSEVDDVGYLVDNGWVDNAFDTQRRRGVAPSARTTFELS